MHTLCVILLIALPLLARVLRPLHILIVGPKRTAIHHVGDKLVMSLAFFRSSVPEWRRGVLQPLQGLFDRRQDTELYNKPDLNPWLSPLSNWLLTLCWSQLIVSLTSTIPSVLCMYTGQYVLRENRG